MTQNEPLLSNSENQKIISWLEYSRHITPQDCWVLIDGYLYDVSDYLVEHPGGDDILLKYSGIDASIPFNQQQHSPYAVSLRNARKVGKIQTPIYDQQYRLMLQEKKRKLKQARKAGAKKPKILRENISLEEVAQHNSDKSCWIVIEDKVYDVTEYMPSHPGGEGLILDKAGQNATVAFKQAKHSLDAIQKKQQFLIGTIKKEPKSFPSPIHIVLFVVAVIAGIWFFVGSVAQQ